MVIKDCLDNFCSASGQRVNYNKSHIMFSSNVPRERMETIANSIRIQQTNDMGRYLGVKTIHGRTTTSHFTHILEKINTRLKGWKTRHLSLAGRRVMAQSVRASSPYCTMQSTYLSKSICDEIDKKIRKFIWGSKEGERKIHLVSWDKVTLERDKGGMGIRKAEVMNQAFLAKMRWRLEVKHDKLWTQVLRMKYNHKENGIQAIKDKREASNLWRGLCKTKHVVQDGIHFKVNNGRRTKLWTEAWVDEQLLLELAPPDLTKDLSRKTVVHYWLDEEGWKWNLMRDR